MLTHFQDRLFDQAKNFHHDAAIRLTKKNYQNNQITTRVDSIYLVKDLWLFQS